MSDPVFKINSKKAPIVLFDVERSTLDVQFGKIAAERQPYSFALLDPRIREDDMAATRLRAGLDEDGQCSHR